MTTRLRSLSLLIAVAVAAFTLGSVGTAVAGPGLTEKAVAKIAGKVVKKKAPGLTVKNATRLAGKPASSYEDSASVFTVSIAVDATSHEVTLPLKPGSHQVTYSAYLAGGSGASVCSVQRQRTGSLVFITAEQVVASSTQAMSGVGIVDVKAGDRVLLRCASDSAWSTSPADPIQITATRLDSVTHAALAAS